MVFFYDIEVKDGIFKAKVCNKSTGYEEEVLANVDGSYHSSSDIDIVKATWNVILKAEKNGNKYPKEASVIWG